MQILIGTKAECLDLPGFSDHLGTIAQAVTCMHLVEVGAKSALKSSTHHKNIILLDMYMIQEENLSVNSNSIVH